MLGAYFPDWLFSIVGEILLARDRAPSRKAFRRRKVAVVAFASDRTVALYQRGLADRLATTTSQQQLIAEKLSLVEPEGRTLEEQLVLMTAPGGGYQRFARRALATPSTGSARLWPLEAGFTTSSFIKLQSSEQLYRSIPTRRAHERVTRCGNADWTIHYPIKTKNSPFWMSSTLP
ncbi:MULTISPECIES: hypothetical protein [Paraburkholderia]|uniref:hypothetical protein n=1 Tax=Paraburkholderia TaxID=1822464 RepID=UPI0038B72F5D